MLEKLTGVTLLTASLLVAPNAAADLDSPDGRLTMFLGPYVYHYSDNAEHNNEPHMVGFEWKPEKYVVDFGLVYFVNSFYQDSVYAYVGKRWFLSDSNEGVFLNLTAGPLYGYRDQYENKVPFNHNGLGFAIIPGIGYQYRSVNAQFVILGTAAIMMTFGYDFYR
jgi:hypothetical protein